MNTVAFTYLGVTIYHTFKDNDPWERLMRYWFSLSADVDGPAFDVRELRAWNEVSEEEAAPRSRQEVALCLAIATGELTGVVAQVPTQAA